MQIGQGASQYGQGAAPSEIGLTGTLSHQAESLIIRARATPATRQWSTLHSGLEIFKFLCYDNTILKNDNTILTIKTIFVTLYFNNVRAKTNNW